MNRYDIVEAHAVLEWDYNVGGWLRERPSNLRRLEATSVQLNRMQFHPHPNLCFETLSEDARGVYFTNVLRWKLPTDEVQRKQIIEALGEEQVASFSHPDFQMRPVQSPGRA